MTNRNRQLRVLDMKRR